MSLYRSRSRYVWCATLDEARLHGEPARRISVAEAKALWPSVSAMIADGALDTAPPTDDQRRYVEAVGRRRIGREATGRPIRLVVFVSPEAAVRIAERGGGTYVDKLVKEDT